MAKKPEDAPLVAGLLADPAPAGSAPATAPDAAPDATHKPDAAPTATDILRALLRESRAFQIEQREQHKVLSGELDRIKRALAELGIQRNPAQTPGERTAQDAPQAPQKHQNGNGARFDRDAASAAYENCLKAFSVPFDGATGKVDWSKLNMTQADLYRLMAASDAPTTGQYQFQGTGSQIGAALGDARRLWVARASARGDAAEAKVAVMRWLAEPVPDSPPRISRYQALTSGLVAMGDLYPLENLQKVRALVPADPSVTVADAAQRAAQAHQAQQPHQAQP